MWPSVAVSLPVAGAWVMLIAYCCARSSRLTLTLFPWYNSMEYYVIYIKQPMLGIFLFHTKKGGI